jgi:hypothetical protein
VAITVERQKLLDGTAFDVFFLHDESAAMPHFLPDFLTLVREWDCARGIRL